MSLVVPWAARRPVLALVLVGVPASWAVLLLPQLVRPGLVPLPVLVLGATWAVLLPLALLVTAAADGRAGVRRLLRSAVGWPSGAGRWPAALLPLALPTTTVLLGLLLGGGLVRPEPGALVRELVAFGSAVLLIHLAEEMVWAGVVQHRLTQRHHPLVAAALTAGPFAAVHLPLLVSPGVTAGRLLAGLGGLVVLAVVVRLLVATVAGSAACVLPAALLHGSFNASANEGRLVDAVLARADADLLGTVGAVLLVAATLAVRPSHFGGAGRHPGVGYGAWRGSERSTS